MTGTPEAIGAVGTTGEIGDLAYSLDKAELFDMPGGTTSLDNPPDTILPPPPFEMDAKERPGMSAMNEPPKSPRADAMGIP